MIRLTYNQQMNDRAHSLLREALTLPVAERAEVAPELLASLIDSEDPAEVQAAWATEIERRARRVLAGESSGEPWPDVRDRVANKASTAVTLTFRIEPEAAVELEEAAT